ncbi:TonB family protein [Cupriavidus sp. CP313]
MYPDADSLEDNPTAVVTVQLGSDGAVISALLTKASGNAKWDSTVLAAVRNASPLPVLSLPRDRQFTITFRPLE